MEPVDKSSIAILGVSGYIGRALFHELLQDSSVAVTGYSRNIEAAKTSLAAYKISGDIKSYEELMDHKYDVVINATGIGSPKKLNADPAAVYVVTEEMDRMVFGYLDKYPKTRVFNLSSGAVYGLAALDYVTPVSSAAFNINNLTAKDGYALAKLHSEARHRSRKDCAIIDLRVFAFVSRFLDPEDSFLVSEIAKCLKEKKTIKTKPDDIVRDFTTANDIADVIKFLMRQPATNDVFDLKSQAATGKFELLNKLKEELGLAFEVEDREETSPTGAKNIYAPRESRLDSMGYSPRSTSLQNVTNELRLFLEL